jgi:rod shape-determining protein MreB
MKDIGIDLGTTNILIYAKDEGIILNEPSVIAIDTETKEVLAVGEEANKMLGRTPNRVRAIKPIKDGVIADFEYTSKMLEELLKKIKKRGTFKKNKVLICCPANVTQVEKNAMYELAENIGTKKIYIEDEPKAAALGTGLEIEKASGCMIIDIGGGTTDITILSLGSIVDSSSIKIAGNTFDKAIIDYIKSKYDLLIGEKTAEEIKLKLGTVTEVDTETSVEIKGRSISEGMPKTIRITEQEIKEALIPQIDKINEEIKKVLENTLPELSSDIVDKGIIITGGGALIKGIAKYIEENIKIPIYIAENPITCVADGCGILLDNPKYLEQNC